MTMLETIIINVHPSMLVTILTEIVFIAIFVESWRESSFSTIFSILSLIICHISDHLGWKLSNLLSKRGSQTNQASQHCDSEKIEKILYDPQQFLSPRWNAKRFHSAQVLIAITENEKSQARCWISWWGDGTETLTVLRSKRKAGSVGTWLCGFLGISAFIIPL